LAQDDYYYEIQLTNKQLVFYFIAGAAGLVLAFLAGVMVGRGLENGSGAEAARAVAEERVVAEQTPAPAPTDYSYAQRLESDRPSEGLDRPAVVATPASTATPAAAPAPEPTPFKPAIAKRPAIPTPAPATAAVLPKTVGTGASARGFAVQVGSFKDRASADVVVKSLKSRGLPAFAVAPAGHAGGFFPVRVGVYRDRADAKAVQDRLRDDKFQPIIIKQ
jgi:DedD protein